MRLQRSLPFSSPDRSSVPLFHTDSPKATEFQGQVLFLRNKNILCVEQRPLPPRRHPQETGKICLGLLQGICKPKNCGGRGLPPTRHSWKPPAMIHYSVTFMLLHYLMSPQREYSTSEGVNFLLLRAARLLYFIIFVTNGDVFSCHLSHWDCWYKTVVWRGDESRFTGC